jgi:hypothetical protein
MTSLGLLPRFLKKHSFLARPPARILLCFLALGALALGWVRWSSGHTLHGAEPGIQRQALAQGQVPSLAGLLALPPAQRSEFDIALLNLLCAEGLPGAETVDLQGCIATLDRWTARVRSETERHLYRYRANPREFESSEGYFRMLLMAVVLYEDFSIRYNPSRMTAPEAADPNDHFFADSRDLFLHGLLTPALNSQFLAAPERSGGRSAPNYRTGTCSSMPVLYVAVGRRLGYPLKLATTKAHLFLRWEGAGERFDLEATGKGMNRYDDEHFKQWPFPVNEEEIRSDGYLKSLTPTEELALFLSLRGQCLMEAGRRSAAEASYAQAVRLAPTSKPYRALLAAAQQPSQSGTAQVARSPGLVQGHLPTKLLALPAAPASATVLDSSAQSSSGVPPGPALALRGSLSPEGPTLNRLSDPNPLNKMRQP